MAEACTIASLGQLAWVAGGPKSDVLDSGHFAGTLDSRPKPLALRGDRSGLRVIVGGKDGRDAGGDAPDAA